LHTAFCAFDTCGLISLFRHTMPIIPSILPSSTSIWNDKLKKTRQCSWANTKPKRQESSLGLAVQFRHLHRNFTSPRPRQVQPKSQRGHPRITNKTRHERPSPQFSQKLRNSFRTTASQSRQPSAPSRKNSRKLGGEAGYRERPRARCFLAKAEI